jgi:hypothetical protein
MLYCYRIFEGNAIDCGQGGELRIGDSNIFAQAI